MALVGVVAGCGGQTEPAPPPPALVTVTVPDGLRSDRATGFVVGPGRVLTVAHAVDGARGITVSPTSGSDGTSRRDGGGVDDGHPARAVRIDREADLALLAVPGIEGPVVRVTDATDDLAVGRIRAGRATRTGAAEAQRRTATFTPLDGPTVRRAVLHVPVTARPGDSGSPVLDTRGRVAGILFAADDSRTSHAWAVAAPAVRAILGR